METEVSVIVPVYRSEKYLQACIDSLLSQTLREMEFIFVCDASPDGCLAILRRAEKKDPRVRVITFEENRGVSAARNAGLDAAKGKFIGFCDSDDWVEPDMFETLLAAARANDADNVFCRVFKDRGEKSENVPLGFSDGTVFDHAEIRNMLIPAMLAQQTDSDELPLSGYTPRNLFSAQLVEKIRFREDIRYAEDLLFIVMCLREAKRAAAVDKAFYHYRIYSESATKAYNPHYEESVRRSDDCLEQLLGDSEECVRRIGIRRRKMAVTVIRNICRIGTPYGFFERVRRAKAFMAREDVRSWFRDIDPERFGVRLGFRLALVKYRQAFLSCLIFSTVYRKA